MYLGIDFGTCFSSVAVLDENGKAQTNGVLRGDTQNTGMPTVMAPSPYVEDEVLCGFFCETDDGISEKEKIRYIKKQIRKHASDGDPILEKPDGWTHDREFHYSRLDMIHFFLTELLRNAIRNIQESDRVPDNKKVEGVTITVPAGLGTTGDYSKHYEMRTNYAKVLIGCVEYALKSSEITKLLTEQNGLPVKVTTIAEPVAAAIAFLKQSQQINTIKFDAPQGKILVLDLGGGTCDVTAVGYDFQDGDYPTFNVLAESGDLDLGGNDWTEALYSYISRRYFRGGLPKSGIEYLERMKKLENVKINLSDRESVGYTEPDRGTIVITRSEFEEATSSLCKRVLGLVEKVANTQGGIDEFQRIVLVGGACRMPQIVDAIKKNYSYFVREPRAFDPSKAIASGAAFYASGEGFKIVVKAPASYGIRYTDNNDKTQMINNLIFKGDVFHDGRIVGCSMHYVAQKDDQTTESARIYESDSREQCAELDEKKFSFNNVTITVSVPCDCLGKACSWWHYYELILYENGTFGCKVYDCYKKDSQGNTITTRIPDDRIKISKK